MAEEERTVLLANRLQQGPVTEPLRLLGRMFHTHFFHTVLMRTKGQVISPTSHLGPEPARDNPDNPRLTLKTAGRKVFA
jgi:hypothetical protein